MSENLIEASENILSGLEVIKTMTLPCGSRPTPQGAEVEWLLSSSPPLSSFTTIDQLPSIRKRAQPSTFPRSSFVCVSAIFSTPAGPHICFRPCVQVVLRGPDVGDLHAGGVSVPRHPGGGALQAAEGGTPNGQTHQLHT